MEVATKVATKDLQALQVILDSQATMEAELEELREKNAALEEQIKAQADDMKGLEQFRPLLAPVPLGFYKIQLRDSAVMKQLLGRMTRVYGPRFDRELKDIGDLDAEQTKFIRQCLDSAVLACVRHAVMNTSIWNQMVERYLS